MEPPNSKGLDKVVQCLNDYISASASKSQSYLTRLNAVLTENDHIDTRRLIVRSAFRCLSSKSDKLARLLCLVLDCDWYLVKDDIVTAIVSHGALECYRHILSTDVVINELWSGQRVGLCPFARTEWISTDTLFSTLLPDAGHRRIVRFAGQAVNNINMFSPDCSSVHSKEKTKAVIALETLKSCHSCPGLYQSLTRIYRRPLLPCGECQIFLLTVLVRMGHIPSAKLIKSLEESGDFDGFISWYKLSKSQPLSLRECARFSIRRSMKKDNLRFAVAQLHLPQILKEFILFEEIEIEKALPSV